MNGGEAADVAVFAVCIMLFVLYNGLYYFSSTFSHLLPPSTENLWRTGKQARSLWAETMMTSSSEALLAVHTVRNLLISVAWFAAADSALIVSMLNILTNPSSIAQIEEYSSNDPITHGDSFMSVPVKISLALSTLFISLLLFVQSARMAVHLGFLVRVVPDSAMSNTKVPFRQFTVVQTQRMNFQFSIGVRLLFAFVPLTFYAMLGTLALLISTVVLLCLMVYLDVVTSTTAAAWTMRTHEASVMEASIGASVATTDVAKRAS